MAEPIISVKTCTRCRIEKPRAHFYKQGQGLTTRCRECLRDLARRQGAGEDVRIRPRNRTFVDPMNGELLRSCRVCKQIKQPSEFYPRSFKSPHLQSQCSECSKMEATSRRNANPEQARAIARRSYHRDLDKSRAYGRAAQAKRPADIRKAEQRAYHQANPHIAHNRYQRDKEKHKAQCAAWRKANRKKVNAYATARRARQLGAAIVEHVTRDEIIARDGSVCYLCGRTLRYNEVTLDHVVSIARGGDHAAYNLKIACGSCNSAKFSLMLEEFLAKKERIRGRSDCLSLHK